MELKLLIKNSKYRVRKINREIFIFGGGQAYSLNETGLEIWKLIGKVKDQEELIDRLLEKYEADRTELEKYTNCFINELVRLNIVFVKE